MLAYASSGPGREVARPRALLLIVAGHALAIGAVMFVRGDIVPRHREPPLILDPIAFPPDPPPVDHPVPKAKARPTAPLITRPVVDANVRALDPPIERSDTVGHADGATTGDSAGSGTSNTPPLHQIVRHPPTILTTGDNLRPPYPDSKRMLEQEAVLTLELSIDESGRVVAVEPIGQADAVFLASARKHLLRVWRFSPATEDGAPVASTKVVTLRFQLNEE